MEAKLNIRKNAKCYYVRLIWQEASGKRRQTEVSTGIPIEGGNKRKAKQRMEELKEEYRQKYEVCNLTYTKDVLFADFMITWLENHRRNIRNSTYQDYKMRIESCIVPYFSKLGVTLRNLTPLMIDKILEAVRDSVIESCVILGIYYGLRRSEICGLCWEDIDFDKDTIHIHRTRTKVCDEVFEENTKSNTSNRLLPLIPDVKKYLERLYNEQREYKKIFGNAYQENDFVCKWQDGKPISCDYVSRNFKTMLEKNGLP